MKFKFYYLLILLIIILPSFAFSQTDEKTFNDALKLFEDKRYYSAIDLFDKIIKETTASEYLTASIIFKGKSLFEVDKPGEAREIALDFLNKYPSSKYVDEARFLLVKIYYKNEDYLKAFNQLLTVIENSQSFDYVTDAVKSAGDIACQHLSVENIEPLQSSYNSRYIKAFLLFLSAQIQINNNVFSDAQGTLNELLNRYPESDFKDGAQLLLNQIKNGNLSSAANETNVCVMLPLSNLKSSDALSASREILEGVKFAFDEFNRDRDDRIGLIIRDSENERTKIINIRDGILNDPSVKVVLGPVFSSEVEIALEEFQSIEIPVVSPTATDNDLTKLNENFFQANPNFVIRAKAMAQYIYYVENKRRMAVLNSIDGYSPLLAAEFIKEFEKLGGEIIAKYTYKSKDLSSNILIDSTEMDAAEGLYIPLSDKSDVPLILSQLVRNNIFTTLYGNQDWFQAKGFETSPELTNKMIFTSDYFIEYNSDNYQVFNKKFMDKTKIDANRNVLYGYDLAKYILTVLRSISRDRKNVIMKMENGISVTGFHNNISFSNDHVNVFMNIIRYNEGYFELIDKFKVGK